MHAVGGAFGPFLPLKKETLPAAERSVSRGRSLSNMTLGKKRPFGGPDSPASWSRFSFYPSARKRLVFHSPNFSETPIFIAFPAHFRNGAKKCPKRLFQKVLLSDVGSEDFCTIGLFLRRIFGLGFLKLKTTEPAETLYFVVFSMFSSSQFLQPPETPKYQIYSSFWHFHFWAQNRAKK